MSFTSEVKDELSRVEPGCSHCEKATLAALVRIEGTLFLGGGNRYRLELATDFPAVARLIIRLLHEVYRLKTELTVRRSVLNNTPNFLIEVPAQPHLKESLIDMGVLSEEGGLEMGIKPELVEKRCCMAAYLRGAFLGSGFVSDPKGDFHFEILAETMPMAEGIVALMAEKDIQGKIVQRRNSYMVYLKSGSSIVDFLTFTGAHHCVLNMESERVVKSARNDANRIANADMANSLKTGKAAAEQIAAIEKIKRHYRDNEGQIPEALRQVMELRLRYDDVSLKELGELANPPLSKSAVYHRIRRIEAMASEIQ